MPEEKQSNSYTDLLYSASPKYIESRDDDNLYPPEIKVNLSIGRHCNNCKPNYLETPTSLEQFKRGSIQVEVVSLLACELNLPYRQTVCSKSLILCTTPHRRWTINMPSTNYAISNDLDHETAFSLMCERIELALNDGHDEVESPPGSPSDPDSMLLSASNMRMKTYIGGQFYLNVERVSDFPISDVFLQPNGRKILSPNDKRRIKRINTLFISARTENHTCGGWSRRSFTCLDAQMRMRSHCRTFTCCTYKAAGLTYPITSGVSTSI